MARDFDPFTSLDGATATGPGSARDLEGVYREHTMVVTTTAGANVGVTLEGSHDGSAWFGLGNVARTLSDGPGGNVLTVSTHLVAHVRANITSVSGGSPAVTATIATGGT